MKTEEKLNLDGAFPETPEMCRAAVLRAVGSCREEEKMRRPFMAAIVAAIILVLLGGTALALVSRSSVRDTVANGAPSKQFEENIMALESSQTSNGVTVTLGDAVFDGKELDFTMTLSAEEGADTVLLCPWVEAYRGETKLDIDVSAQQRDDLTFGLLYPAADARSAADDSFTVTAELDGSQPDGAVRWRYTVYVLQPNWEIVAAPERYDGWEAWEEAFRQAYRDRKIMAEYGTSVEEYADAVAESVIGNDHVWEHSFLMDTMLASGAFDLADTLVFEFSTDPPEYRKIVGEGVFRFDGYDVAVKEISTSFMRVHYTLEIRLDEPFAQEHGLQFYYDLYDQDGNPLPWKSSMISGGGDLRSLIAAGSVTRISDEPLTGLRFRPSEDFCQDESIRQDEFTVSLE